MKPLRLNKVLGLSVGEKSLLAAEVVAGDKGGRPDVKQLAEFVYPEGISTQNPEALGKALGDFLRDNKFTAKNAILGLPARWLVVKAKDVPPSDPTTLAAMLRLQAEGEFSAELKDLVYDYAADSVGYPKSVLLVATSRKYIDAVNVMCEAAKLSPEIITSSAVALGIVTGRSVESKNPLVLMVSPAGAELTAQSGTASSAIRHLRGPGPDRPFVGELRRAISGLTGATANGSPRELVLWDAAGTSTFDSSTLGESLGVTVRNGDLPVFGVTTTDATRNGDGRKYAAAVSLALLGVVEESRPVDFLHSRLAPPKTAAIPLWMILSGAATLLLIGLIFYAINDHSNQQAAVEKLKTENDGYKSQVTSAQAFVDEVTYAQTWHMTSPRYLDVWRDLTNIVPPDQQTYVLGLTLHELPPPSNSGSLTPAEQLLKAATVRTITGRLEGKTTDQQSPHNIAQLMEKKPTPFSNIVENSTQKDARGPEWSFSIDFTYTPAVGPVTAAAQATSRPATAVPTAGK